LRKRNYHPDGFLQIVTGGPGKLAERFVGSRQHDGPLVHTLFEFGVEPMDSFLGFHLQRVVADRGGQIKIVADVKGAARDLGGKP
jgi:hypothetical protein